MHNAAQLVNGQRIRQMLFNVQHQPCQLFVLEHVLGVGQIGMLDIIRQQLEQHGFLLQPGP